MHKGPCLRFLSSGGLGISVIEASGSVTGHLVRGILGKSDVEMRGGLNWLRIVFGGGFFCIKPLQCFMPLQSSHRD